MALSLLILLLFLILSRIIANTSTPGNVTASGAHPNAMAIVINPNPT